MSLLTCFDDRECRAWFAAVVAIRAIPDPPRARNIAASQQRGDPQQGERRQVRMEEPVRTVAQLALVRR
jgi:hypothetical protein